MKNRLDRCKLRNDRKSISFFVSKEKKIDISLRDNEELREMIVDRIENIILTMIEQLSAGILPSISYRITDIDTLIKQIERINSRSIKNEDDPKNSIISGSFEEEGRSSQFPERKSIVSLNSERSQGKFALIVKTMAKLHYLLIANRTETRRAFFYELKGNESTKKLINSQAQIDTIVNIVANILDCPSWNMALVPAAKGLASGDLTMTLKNKEEINCRTFGGVLIPPILSNVVSLRSKADLVLIVEKEAVFHKLYEENCPRRLNCILITGKGYPDVATRMLVKILAEKLGLPVYILVDADPYGIEIMLVYKYGSIALSYDEENLACPSLRWLGLFPSEFSSLKIPKISLTDADIGKLDAIKSRPYLLDRVSEELKIMRSGKAEIEAIKNDEENRDLTSFYLWTKIQNADYVQ